VAGQQVVSLAGHPHSGGDQHDQVVADALQVGDQVRGHHDAAFLIRGDLHQDLQELPAGQRVQTGDRLVQDQQLGPLGEGQRLGQLGALTSGELPRSSRCAADSR
jgi:hypothetical protein